MWSQSDQLTGKVNKRPHEAQAIIFDPATVLPTHAQALDKVPNSGAYFQKNS